MSEAIPGLVYGTMVLSATHRVPLPLISQDAFRDHIPGVVFQGRSGTLAPFYHMSAPEGGRRLFTNRRLTGDLAELLAMDSQVDTTSGDFKSVFAEKFRRSSMPGDVLVLDQNLPFGLTGLFSREGGLRLFGVYSEACSLLVWANTPDIEKLVNPSSSRMWRVLRFKEHDSFSAVVFTARVCARWHRWSTQSAPLNIEQRFQALEASLLGSESWMTSF